MATPTRASASAKLRTKHQLWLLFLRSSLSRAAATSRLVEVMRQEAMLRVTPITRGFTSLWVVSSLVSMLSTHGAGILFIPLPTPSSNCCDEFLCLHLGLGSVPKKPQSVFNQREEFFPDQSVRKEFFSTGLLRRKMSLKRRLLSMLLCCVYCVASLFCLHPNRNNCFSMGARNLLSVVQQLYQRAIRLLRTTL
ncbi:hypothetical protein FQN60_000465 [Etheostoma spectabile]|uniref:Transmembrane protein n=1 Tax=Etheostoma spectabile TaxID=54343 RepID=A0A5J5CZN8_9PERO|nr:hypothetical protein FQN60_000465 [Etheostoma spectabile]